MERTGAISIGARRAAPKAAIVLSALAALGLAGCSPVVETDQARLCRMTLPALAPSDAALDVLSETPDLDGRGLYVAFAALRPDGGPERHLAHCRFRAIGRPRESRDLVGLSFDGETLGEARLFALVRYWLATPEARAADPAPLGDLSLSLIHI